MIFSLLLPFVHREGGIGQQARDALLLCMALSASHTSVGQYIAQHSNFCPVSSLFYIMYFWQVYLQLPLFVNICEYIV